MKTYTVNQLARMVGVSVRTLHHYDQIGLLKPAFTGENRYRYYGREEMARLQQVLIHREFDIPLAEIAAILDGAEFDRLKTLQRQRERLKELAGRYAGMLATIELTIAGLKGDCAMKDADLYSGLVSPGKQAEHESWLIEKCGSGIKGQIAATQQAWGGMNEADRVARMDELRDIEQGLADGLRRGVPPESPILDPLIARHRDWVAVAWGKPCSPQAYATLAEVYEHFQFTERYEAIELGFSEYLKASMSSWAERQS